MGKQFIYFVLTLLGIKPPETQTSFREQAALTRYALGKKCLVEIGVYQGVNTARMRKVMDSDATIFAVDPYLPGRLGFSYDKIIAHREVNKIKNGKVVWMQKKSDEAGIEYKRQNFPPIDFIFIDALHTYEGLKKDWFTWSGKIAQGGIVAIHDAISNETKDIDDAGSVKFTKEVILQDARFRLIETVDTLIGLKKIVS